MDLLQPLESPDSLTFAPLAKVSPLVQTYIGVPSERLVELYPQERLVKLGQLLVARFFNEVLQLQRGVAELQNALSASERRCEEFSQLPELERLPPPAAVEVTLAPQEACPLCSETLKKLELCERELRRVEGQGGQGLPMLLEAPQLMKKKAAVVLQAAWRRKAAQLRFERHLLSLIFRAEAPRAPATISSLRLLQGILGRIWRALQRRGLDFELAYRCADAGYQKYLKAEKGAKEHADGSSMRVGHFLRFLCKQQGLPMAELSSLLRLFKRRDRGNRVAKLDLAGKESQELHEAWLWEMPYSYAQELQCLVAPRVPTALAALQGVQAALKSRCHFQWGDLAPTWRRLVLDAQLLQLAEECERLKSDLKEGSKGDLEAQLADCEAELSELMRSATASAVSCAAWAARLQELPLAPVTLQAAAQAAAREAPGASGMVEEMWKLDSGCGFVRFKPCLSSSPQLLHLTTLPLSFRLEELTERGMRLSAVTKEPLEELLMAFSAGDCQGVLRVAKATEVHFVPRLARPPETVVVQTWRQKKELQAPQDVSCVGRLDGLGVCCVEGPQLVLRLARPTAPTAAKSSAGDVVLDASFKDDQLQLTAHWPLPTTAPRALPPPPARRPRVERVTRRGFVISGATALRYEASGCEAVVTPEALQELAPLPAVAAELQEDLAMLKSPEESQLRLLASKSALSLPASDALSPTSSRGFTAFSMPPSPPAAPAERMIIEQPHVPSTKRDAMR